MQRDDWGMDADVERVAAGVLAAKPVNSIRIVGVDGPGGAGKSTFAEALGVELGTPVVHTDDFLSWADIFGWWPRFEEQVLRPLAAGEAAHFQVRDWENDQLGDSLAGWATVEWSPIVIVEGVSSTRRESLAFLSFAVWLETPPAERFRRGVARDGDHMRELWTQAMRDEDDFFAADGTRARANAIVSGC